ncbi:MAG: PTS sugar transporter subunit IIA [Candidatus Hydrogenedentes bacterium]|nr:PTS sugar transporter subunit IIA [Candidatus Hydrogenedentota bacterium]
MSAFGVEIPPSLICLFEPGVSKQSALEQLIVLTLRAGIVTNETAFREAVFERESIMSTGIGAGVAIPHVRIPEVAKPTLAVGVSRDGIDFGTLDDAPVHIVVLFAMPFGAHREYLVLLAQVISTLKLPGFRDLLLSCNSPETIAATINSM